MSKLRVSINLTRVWESTFAGAWLAHRDLSPTERFDYAVADADYAIRALQARQSKEDAEAEAAAEARGSVHRPTGYR